MAYLDKERLCAKNLFSDRNHIDFRPIDITLNTELRTEQIFFKQHLPIKWKIKIRHLLYHHGIIGIHQSLKGIDTADAEAACHVHRLEHCRKADSASSGLQLRPL